MKKVIITIILSIVSITGIGGFKIVNNQSKENSINNIPEIQNEIATDENLINEEIVIPLQDDENKTSTDEVTPPSEPEQNNSENDKVEVSEKTETKKSTTSNSASSGKSNTSSNQNVNTKKSTTASTKTTTSSNSDSTTKKDTSTSSDKNTSPTPSTPQTTSQTENKKDEVPKEDVPKNETPVRCTNNHNHGMDVGNSGQWFSSKSDAIAYYNSQISHWGNLWETDQIDDATYYKNCPKGYEIWSCMYCSKWTINFYYR